MNLYTNDCLFGYDPRAKVFTHVWKLVQQECLREFNYMAQLTELDFDTKLDYDHIEFKWSGFNHCMPNYVKETMERLIQLKDNAELEKVFDQIKEKLLLDWKNFYLEQSYR